MRCHKGQIKESLSEEIEKWLYEWADSMAKGEKFKLAEGFHRDEIWQENSKLEYIGLGILTMPQGRTRIKSHLGELAQKEVSMEWKDLLIDSYDEAFKSVERALDGLSQEDLDLQSRPDCNSIGWTAWHQARELDGLISSITGEEQLWIKDKWHEKFNRSPDPTDSGTGHSPEQVAAFNSPDVQTLLDYYKAVLENSKSSIASLSSSDLNRKIEDPWAQYFPTVKSRLMVALSEALQHAGQVGYIRGLQKGKGWQEF